MNIYFKSVFLIAFISAILIVSSFASASLSFSAADTASQQFTADNYGQLEGNTGPFQFGMGGIQPKCQVTSIGQHDNSLLSNSATDTSGSANGVK